MRRHVVFLLGLLVITLASLWPVGRLGFTGYDDIDYVYQNPHVQSGLNLDSIVWAFTTASVGVWHPLTWMSHMLDCDLFGLNPPEEHWVNLGFHAANTLLLFCLLHELTGARWRSFLVAALFACHPLHVQSVAWISERKDVLSGFFGFLTLLAYTRYCRLRTTGNYCLVIVLFALGLMAKPMLVSLPLVMLLLDFWPLGRIRATPPESGPPPSKIPGWLGIWRPPLVEKIPFFLLSGASCVIAVWAEKSTGTVVSTQVVSGVDRCLNTVLSYGSYLGKMFWPVNLAIFYPLPGTKPDPLEVTGVLLALLLVSLACLSRWRAQPYLLVGWLWFVIMLLPVIGLVQIGLQSIADRYTYLPSVGLFIALAWGLAEVAGNSRLWRTAVAGLAALGLLACGLDARYQLGFWRDDITLFNRVVQVTPENNYMGYFYLGISYAAAGDFDSAARCLGSAVKTKPNFELARSRLGNILLVQKKYSAAEFQLKEVIKAQPQNIGAHMSLGYSLAGLGDDAGAQSEFPPARQLQPDDPVISQALAASTRRVDTQHEVAGLLNELKTNATPKIHLQIAADQNVLGHYQSAADQYQAVLAENPDSLEALNNLAWLLATCPDAPLRDGSRAIQLAGHACELTQFKQTVCLGTLAAAYAEAGRFDKAVATAQKACANASANGETDLLGRNQELLARYQTRQPYHEPAEKLVPATQ